MTADRRPRRRAQRELEREARRLFPGLLRDRGYLAAPAYGADGPGEDSLDLFSRRNDYRRPIMRVPAELVRAFRDKGWVETRQNRWTVTDAGAAWLRRHQAGSDPYREQHQMRGTTTADLGGGVRRPVVVNETESPLGWLRRRKGRDGAPMITAEQFEAGERLRADFTRAGLMPSVTANWEAVASSRRSRRAAPDGPAGLTDAALAAKQRVQAALAAVGPELSGILLDVCCHLRGLADAEESRGWPRRSGKVILQLALTRLARHYGLGRAPDDEGRRRPRVRHWGSEDFRPSLDGWR